MFTQRGEAGLAMMYLLCDRFRWINPPVIEIKAAISSVLYKRTAGKIYKYMKIDQQLTKFINI